MDANIPILMAGVALGVLVWTMKSGPLTPRKPNDYKTGLLPEFYRGPVTNMVGPDNSKGPEVVNEYDQRYYSA